MQLELREVCGHSIKFQVRIIISSTGPEVATEEEDENIRSSGGGGGGGITSEL